MLQAGLAQRSGAGGRLVLHLLGRREDGPPFLLRVSGMTPSLYLPTAHAAAARAALGPHQPLHECDRRSLRGEALLRLEAPTPAALAALHQRLEHAGVPTHQADLHGGALLSRYLFERDLRGALL